MLLCGDDDDAKAVVAGLVRRMPDLRPIDAGGLAVAPLLDHVTALLLNVNRRHKAETSLRLDRTLTGATTAPRPGSTSPTLRRARATA